MIKNRSGTTLVLFWRRKEKMIAKIIKYLTNMLNGWTRNNNLDLEFCEFEWPKNSGKPYKLRFPVFCACKMLAVLLIVKSYAIVYWEIQAWENVIDSCIHRKILDCFEYIYDEWKSSCWGAWFVEQKKHNKYI